MRASASLNRLGRIKKGQCCVTFLWYRQLILPPDRARKIDGRNDSIQERIARSLLSVLGQGLKILNTTDHTDRLSSIPTGASVLPPQWHAAMLLLLSPDRGRVPASEEQDWRAGR